jgi:hypothetical protein
MKTPFSSKYNPTALELGHIIMNWAMIDDVLDAFIAELVHIGERDPIADILTGNIEFRSKIQIIKGLAFIRCNSEEWQSIVVRLLDHIDNELRPKRNLFAHAHWFHMKKKSNTATIVTKKTKLIKPQAFKLDLETRQTQDFKLSDLRKFRTHLNYVFIDLLLCYFYIMREDDSVGQIEEHTLSFRQYLRAVGYKIRSICVTPKQKRPRKLHQVTRSQKL